MLTLLFSYNTNYHNFLWRGKCAGTYLLVFISIKEKVSRLLLMFSTELL